VNRFKNLKTRTKLIISFGVIGVLMISVCWISMSGINKLTDRVEFIYKTNLTPVKALGDLHGQSERMSALIAWHILAHDTVTMTKWTKEIAKLDEDVDRFLEFYPPVIVAESERKIYDEYKKSWSEYKDVRSKVLGLSANFSKDAASELQGTELAGKLESVIDGINGLTRENETQAKEGFEYSEDLATTLYTINLAIMIGAFLLGIFLCWFISSVISHGLEDILKAAQSLAAGNLTARSGITTQDDVGSLAMVFNHMGEEIEANATQALESKYKMTAIDRVQTVIEFSLDGTVLTANDNCLKTLGYQLSEIKGQHHRMFCEQAHSRSGEEASFWQKLNRGEFDTGVYRRIGKGGKEVWLQASYNPILDANGKVYKVVEFATDITGQKLAQNEVEKLIKTAAAGDLSNRIDVAQFEGAARELTVSVNQLFDAVVTPLREAQTVLTALADCDLTRSMTGVYQGEFEQMKSSLNAAVHKLTETIMVVREAVEAVTTGSEEISKGSEDLSQRTSEQASSLEETSASMEEMTSTVKQSADNAKQANQLAIAAREVAEKGGAVTIRAVEAMGEINKSSKKIADIITVIDEIAFQTNLLALNAAVEAARAGEHGRGFAVVAAEVRNLAQRSATAAKEIKGLINESIQRVMDGSELVNQSGKTLEEIVNSVKRVTDIIAEISAASQEQASGIDQVNKAIMQMDEATQQNAALVEETTSASQTMQQQAASLLTHVSVFKVHASEEQKGESPAITIHRYETARAINAAYGGGDDDAVVRRPQGSHPGVQKRLTPVRNLKAVTVATGNGKDRRKQDEEFEEF
jgi:PAS domain S-box-containing protein